MLVLLTRPLEESREIAEMLEAEGVDCLIWPLTHIAPTIMDLTVPFTVGGLLFTSANGVRAFAALCPRRDLPALCVGQTTAAAARRAGFLNCFSADGDARALADLAQRSGIGEFLHPRGEEAAGNLKDWLAESRQKVTEAVLYKAEETGPAPAPVASALARGEIDLVTVWSRRNAAILARRLAKMNTALGKTALLAISPAAAEPLARAAFGRRLIAKKPDRAAMLGQIRSLFAAVQQEIPE
jgi:uroporphyrinogen-III synthase